MSLSVTNKHNTLELSSFTLFGEFISSQTIVEPLILCVYKCLRTDASFPQMKIVKENIVLFTSCLLINEKRQENK